MPPFSEERPFRRTDMAFLGDVPVSAFATLAARGQLPFFDSAEITSASLDAAEDRAGWIRYSPLDALKFVVSRQLHLGNSSFEGLSYPAAARIVGNARWEMILPHLVDGTTQDVLAGYIWAHHDQIPLGGQAVGGTWSEIFEFCDVKIRSLTLVNVTHCAQLTRARAESQGWLISTDWLRAWKV